MSFRDSSLDPEALEQARSLLGPTSRRDPTWAALLAAAGLAVTSVAFAAVMVLAPPVETPGLAASAPD